MTAAERNLFIEEVAGLIKKIGPAYGCNVVSPILAQAIKESGFGTSELAVNANNILGIKYKEGRTPVAIGSYTKASGEYVGGNLVSQISKFAAFKSWEDCITGYFQFLRSSAAYDNLFDVTDARAYCDMITVDGYAGNNENYGKSLYNDYIIKYNLLKYEDKKMKKIRLLIGAGHDNYRNQSTVDKRYYESEVMWRLQNYLKAACEKRGMEVDLMRQSLSEVKDIVARGKMGKGYDAALELHSDACGTESVDRPSCIYLCDDKMTTADDISKGLASVLAQTIHDTMQTTQAAKTYSKPAGYDRNGNGILTDDEYYGFLHGAHMVNCPANIVEHSFHTNKRSTAWLLNDNNLQRLAENEAAAIATFFNVNVEFVVSDVENVDTVVYKVVKGDNLNKIAKAFGTTVEEIMSLNTIIKNPSVIQPGWKLTIPTGAKKGSTVVVEQQTKYIVKSGDNLTKIAKMYGTTVVKLVALNGIKDASKIYPGQTLVIK